MDTSISTSPRTPPQLAEEGYFKPSLGMPQELTEKDHFETSQRTPQELSEGEFETIPRKLQEFAEGGDFESASRTPEELADGEFEAEWWVVLVCVAGLVCGAITSARLLHHGTSGAQRSSPTTASRVLLCSQAAAGLLQVTVSSPILLLALATCYGGKESAWACSVGWVTWAWAWGVQVLGGLAMAYERVRLMGRPLRCALTRRTALFLAAAAWVCGGVVGVAMGKGLQCISSSSGHPRVAVGVLVGTLLPALLLGVLWAQGVRRLRHATITISSCPEYAREAPRWPLPTPQPSDNLEAIMYTVSHWAAPLFVGSPSLSTSGRPPSPSLHAEALLEGSCSPSPVYSRRSSMYEEDTFTVGGIYIGSLKSHIRAHSGLCTDQNVRSQGCQTGEEEASPPVVEWRVLPPTPTVQETPPDLIAPEVTSVGVQCCSASEIPSPSPRGSALAKELERLVVRETSVRMEAARAAPALVLSVVQALMGVPVPVVAMALHLSDPGPVWAWRVTLMALTVTTPAPALAHGAYLLAAACTRARLVDV